MVRACALLAGIALLSCLVGAFSSLPKSVGSVLSLCHRSLTEQRCWRAVRPSASCIRHAAVAGSPQAAAFPNASPGASRGVGPYGIALRLGPTRPSAQHPYTLAPWQHLCVVLGCSSRLLRQPQESEGENGVWRAATWSTVRAACVERGEIRA